MISSLEKIYKEFLGKIYFKLPKLVHNKKVKHDKKKKLNSRYLPHGTLVCSLKEPDLFRQSSDAVNMMAFDGFDGSVHQSICSINKAAIDQYHQSIDRSNRSIGSIR